MLFLAYERDGIPYKFPIGKKLSLLGRADNCDLILLDKAVSKIHVQITRLKNGILIEDQGSTNKTFINNQCIKKAQIHIGESFRIGHTLFTLKTGDKDELTPSSEVRNPGLIQINNRQLTSEKTTQALHLFDPQLLKILDLGINTDYFGELLEWARPSLEPILRNGELRVFFCKNNKWLQYWALNLDDSTSFLPPLDTAAPQIPREDIITEPIRQFKALILPITMAGDTDKYMLHYSQKDGNPPRKDKIELLKALSLQLAGLFKLNEKTQSQDKNISFALNRNNMVTCNPLMLNLLMRARTSAQGDYPILIQGETGTGKELMARFIHHNSIQKRGKYIAIDCSAIPDSLLETELFGYERGAFTGANQSKKGKLEEASGGTLVLDEIGEMPILLQTKLLRVLQEQAFYPLGGHKIIPVQLRILSLTNKNLAPMVENGEFRQDLLNRLNAEVYQIPPLQERREDIVPLINLFLDKNVLHLGKYVGGFSQKAIQALKSYPWPGNVRELQNEIARLTNLISYNNLIDFDQLKEEIRSHFLRDTPNKISKREILAALEANRWKRKKTAESLGISRQALYEKMKKFNIN